jgi:hypothetical protein
MLAAALVNRRLIRCSANENGSSTAQTTGDVVVVFAVVVIFNPGDELGQCIGELIGMQAGRSQGKEFKAQTVGVKDEAIG